MLAFSHYIESLGSSSSAAVIPQEPPAEVRLFCEGGLDRNDFSKLLNTICTTKHAQAAKSAVFILIPRDFSISIQHLEAIFSSVSLTTSVVLKSAWCRYLCALWDSKSLHPSAKDTFHAAYGLLFYDCLRYHRSQTQVDMVRLLYRLTRTKDVTPVRCKLLNAALLKPNPVSALFALGELFLQFNPAANVNFPPKEGFIPGSGLNSQRKKLLHQKMMMPKHVDLILRFKAVMPLDDDNREEGGERHIQERRHSTKRPRESDPLSVDDDNEEDEMHFMRLLKSWDGFDQFDFILNKLENFSYPLRKTHQDAFFREILTPLFTLLKSISTIEFVFPLCTALGKMISCWITKEENAGVFVSQLLTWMDDLFCHLLVWNHHSTPDLLISVTSFYHFVSQGLLQRSTIFSTSTSAAKPLSESISLFGLLAPSALGIVSMSQLFVDQLPVYRLENMVGSQLGNQNRIQASKYFEENLQDYCRALVLGKLKWPFDKKELLLRMDGDELGVHRSFAFRGLWKRWQEHRGLDTPNLGEESDITDREIVSFLSWLETHHYGASGILQLVSQISVRFQRLMQDS